MSRKLRVPVLYTVYTSASSACFIHGLHERFECLFYIRFIREPRMPVLYTVYTSDSSAYLFYIQCFTRAPRVSVCSIYGLHERLECLFYIRFIRALRVPRETRETHKVRIDKIQVQNPYRK